MKNFLALKHQPVTQLSRDEFFNDSLVACTFFDLNQLSGGPTFDQIILIAVPSCGAVPSLLGSEMDGDHSMKTRDAGIPAWARMQQRRIKVNVHAV